MNEPFVTKTHLRDYIEIISRRRWPALALFVSIVSVVSIISLLGTKEYTATTQVLIEQSSSRALSFQDVLAIDSSQQDFYQTQYKIIASRAIAEAVIRKLVLWRLDEFVGQMGTQELANGEPSSEKVENLVYRAAIVFEKKLKVEPVRQSRLVLIHFTSTNPEIAARCADAIVQAYIDYGLDRRLRITQMTVNFLGKRIEEQRKKVEASQIALQKYMEEQQLVNEISDQIQDISAQKIAELNQQLVQAIAARKEVQAHYQLAQLAQNDTERAQGLLQVQNNPQIQAIRKQQLDSSNKLAELSQRYGPNHPKIAALKAEHSALDRDLRNEIKKILVLHQNQFEVALAKERALEEALEKQKQETMDIRRKSIGYQVLKREVDTNQSLYSMLLSKSKEARVTEEIDIGSVTVVDPAVVPKKPSKPRLFRNVILATLAGVFLGICFAFLLDYMDNTIKFPEDLNKIGSVAFLAHIPYDDQLQTPVRNMANGDYGPSGKLGSQMIDEAFRTLRTTLILSKAESPPKVISITSALPGEGKSFATANLAMSFAAASERTLLLDADMRKPTQHRLWGVSNKFGLSSLLSGTATIEETLYRNIIPNLDIITCGPVPPNPAELLQSKMMDQLLTTFSKHYSKVIIDCPPILPVTDSAIIAHLADGVMLVVSAGKTTTYALKQAIQRLESANMHILGAIINLTVNKKTDYYYKGYRYKYYSQYDYGNGIKYAKSVKHDTGHKKG